MASAVASVTIGNIIAPDRTTTLTVVFDASYTDTENIDAMLSIDPSYAATIATTASSDGGLTWTAEVTIGTNVNKLANVLSVDFNSVVTTATFNVMYVEDLETVKSIRQAHFYDTLTTFYYGYSAFYSKNGNYVILSTVDADAGRPNESRVYAYDADSQTYTQKGSNLKNGMWGAVSNDGNLALIIHCQYWSGSQSRHIGYLYQYDNVEEDWVGIGVTNTTYGPAFFLAETAQYPKIIVPEPAYSSYYPYQSFDANEDLTTFFIAMTDGIRVYTCDTVTPALSYTTIADGDLYTLSCNNAGDKFVISKSNGTTFKIYSYSESSWSLQETVTLSTIQETITDLINRIGLVVRMSGDGLTIVVSDWVGTFYTNEAHTTWADFPHFFVVKYNPISMSYETKGLGVKKLDSVGYGIWTDTTFDGNRIAVGAPGNIRGGDYYPGEVYIYDYNAATDEWDEYTQFVGQPFGYDNLGYTVSLTDDGKRIALAAVTASWDTHGYTRSYVDLYSIEQQITRSMINITMDNQAIVFPTRDTSFNLLFTTNDKTLQQLTDNLSVDPSNCGTLTGLALTYGGFGLTGTFESAIIDSSSNSLIYDESTDVSGSVAFSVDTFERAVSNICFCEDAQVLTDNDGYKQIKFVTCNDTIHGRKVKEITKTKTKDSFLLHMRKGCILASDKCTIPDKNTKITRDHKVLFRGNMITANELYNCGLQHIEKVNYTGETLYNILLEGDTAGRMSVNGMVVETLDPQNNIANLYKIMQGFDAKTKQEIIHIYNEEREEASSALKVADIKIKG